jgi:acyl-CoA synthetase (AMP-forming)/AMP-acid ligase II
VLELALKLFPETDFVNAYGLTETSSTVALLGPDDHRLAMYSDDPVWTARLSSVGLPVPGIEVRVVDDTGADLGIDSPGEVQIRGDQVGGAYADVESKTDADGWLHTGDRGWVDVDGYIFVEGRADDTIIRGGENISPAEIEDALLTHDAVSTACVVGLSDEEWGERIVAAITLRPGVDEIDTDHVRDWVRERVGSLKTPEQIEIRDELPQTATGKILRRQIRTELSAN